MDDPKAILNQLINEYYIRHTAMMDQWYLNRKIKVPSFTEQDEIILQPLVYDEMISSFMAVMKLPEDQRNETITSLHEAGIFHLNDNNYLVFKRN